MTETTKHESGHQGAWVTVVAIVSIVAVSFGIIFLIQATEPEVQRGGATRRSAALVEVVELKRGNFRPTITALGTVEASQRIELRPQVGGEITGFSQEFIPGGFLQEGDLIAEIDPIDYENQLAMRESDLLQAKAALELEKGQQIAAKKEFELLGEEIDASNQSLILREPQIRTAEAQVSAAQAMRDTAQLDLTRTQIKAPFHAQIIERFINLGSQVSSGTVLATLVGIEEYWVIASVPQGDLQWIDLPKGKVPGASVHVMKPAVWGDTTFREGEVLRLIGTLDERTRLARILIGVNDPLARNTDAPPLLLGTIVENRIRGKELSNVFRIKREYLRGDDQVWIKKDGKLDIRTVRVAYLDEKYAYLEDGLQDGESLVMTNLATISEGINLRLINETTDSEDSQ
ncbi:MAG: efflux RND transporter periplasmic adaptor subunit [Verrucomicrobiota bacterium]